jgi:hypothetical protein
MGINDYTKSSVFKNKVETIKSSLTPILDNFKKLYILHNMHPADQEYQQQYNGIVSSITQQLASLFTVSNDIQQETTLLGKKLLPVNESIETEKKTNSDLKKQLKMVTNNTNAADEMIMNYKEMYDKNYLRNWALFLSSIVGLYSISVVFRKPVISTA